MNPLEVKRRAARGLEARDVRPLELPRQVVRLSNGQYTVQLNGVGSGFSECRGLAVSRWVPDPTCDADGFHIFLRDLDDGAVWSAGFQPTRVMPDDYAFSWSPGAAEIARVDGDLECRTTICVDPSDDLELRRCRLTNHGGSTRRIELTSYVEFVLARRDADESHPTFSKLFIETEFAAERNAVLARRRPRSASESEQWACHGIVVGQTETIGDGIQFETNRARFIGRGRTLSRPRALDPKSRLTGDWGAVLDPIGSLRTAISLEAGETCQIVWMLAAARSRPEIERLAAKVGDIQHSDEIFNAAAQASKSVNGNESVSELVRLEGAAPLRQTVPAPHIETPSAASELSKRAVFRPAADGKDGVVSHNGKREILRFDNGFGGFSADGREYVIRLQPNGRGGHHLPPRPWTNVIANEQAGFLITERGAGYTWAGNSRHNRLTAWNNDPVCDPLVEAIWIRDEEAKTFWSLTPGPTPAAVPYEVRHGFGYTTFQHASHEIEQRVTLFMAPEEPVKLARVQLVNRGRTTRQLTLFSYTQWNLGSSIGDSATAVTTKYDAVLDAILARNPNREQFNDSVAFSAVAVDTVDPADNRPDISYSGDRTHFLGELGQLESPAALVIGKRLDNRVGGNLDPCAAWQVTIELAAGEIFECTILLGEAADQDTTAALIRKYRQPREVERAFEQSKAFWRQMLAAVQIETPDAELDLMVNGWLPYQNLSCRMWARSAYYQPGGAFGFRDQLQDSAAMIFHRPDITRRQIVRHASEQFPEGDVLHWWHPEAGAGLRTRFSDDLLWLPYVTASYIAATGDEKVLDEVVPFINGPELAAEQQEAYLHVESTDVTATVYEHCCRAMDRGLTTGAHGLPLFGCGDWNDGMNRVGSQGRGESVWLGFFIASVLELMLPICTKREDCERTKRYTAYRDQLLKALDTAGWDGAWYRRAYYDDETPLGSATSDECQIDALAQAWAVLSGVASPERAAMSVAAVEKRLVDEEAGIIRLLTPAFDRTTHDPGYIKGYLPGIRENGGQYTHGVLWFVRAMAELGRGTRAVELLKMLSPISHSSSPEAVAIYQTEPYVVAADVYGEPPHVGRGGWTWYTGSAGWMFRVAVESILGMSIERGERLVINPSISAKWPRCRISYRIPGSETRYEITIENPNRKERGVVAATVDRKTAHVAYGAAAIPLLDDGLRHEVVIRL
jgi:N,N'-diacetylchitobiose phosphorylase